MALLLDQTHAAYFMDTPLPPAEVDEGEGDSDIGYGDPTSYLYTPTTCNDNDNENDKDTDSEFGREGEEGGSAEGMDGDRYMEGVYWSVTDMSSGSSSDTIDDTNSTNSSRHTDSNTSHAHTLGIADRANNSNVHAPSFTLSPLSSSFAYPSSIPVSNPRSVTGILALPPLGRPYASLNGKRKRQAGMMGGVPMHLPSPITPPTSTPTSALSSSSPFPDAGDDGRTSPIPGKGQRQGLREDQYTPHSPVAVPSPSHSSGRKDHSMAPSTHVAGGSPSPSSSSRSAADGDVTLLPTIPPPPPVSSGIDGTLPAGWLQKFSNREKKNYWFNVITGESIWVKPS